jgi:ketosteroid isomerase-like protein
VSYVTTSDTDVQFVQRALQRLIAAVAAGDVGAYLAEWADDGVVMPPGQPMVTGKPAIRAWLGSTLEQFDVSVRVTQHECQIGGDWIIDRHSYVITATPKSGGKALIDHGKAVGIWKRVPDGTWKAYIDCWNSDAPPSS